MSASRTCDECGKSTTKRAELEGEWLKFVGAGGGGVLDACSFPCVRTLVDKEEAAMKAWKAEEAEDAAAAAAERASDA